MRDFQGHKLITTISMMGFLIAILTGVTLSRRIFFQTHIPMDAYVWLIFWLCAAILFCILSYREFVVGFLISLFCMMISWRIAAIYSISVITYSLLVVFVCMLMNFIYCAWDNVHHPRKYVHHLSIEQWQLVFIRLYIGFDFIPHFVEKLFAGSLPFMQDVNAFIYLNVPNPEFFVWLAGLCEFGAAIALSLGLFMRVGAIGAALYLIIATYLGNHFSLGFIWAGPGGGWEFAMMWIILILCFAITGAHEFSIDQRLEDKFKLPKWLKKIM